MQLYFNMDEIVDLSVGRSLTVRKAFGDDPTYTNVNVTFAGLDFAITPTNVQQAQAWLQSLTQLDSPPDVLLKTIGYYLQNVAAWAEYVRYDFTF